jgi:hypothetical protein
MKPFFNVEWVREWKRPDDPSGQGRGGLTPSDRLLSKVGSNDLIIATTVTDGNCGLHAFWVSAKHLFQTVRRQPWLSFRKLQLPSVFSELRKLATNWIRDHVGDMLWPDFSIGDLVRNTSSDGTVAAYLDRMRKPGQWVDTSILHALGCVFDVDILVMQCSEDALVGASLMEGSEADDRPLISIALQNDLHFWGCRPMEVARSMNEPVDKGDWVVLPNSRDQQNQEEEAAEQCHVEPEPRIRPDTVNAELALCQVLAKWSPFATPSEEVVKALNVLAEANKGSFNSEALPANATEAGLLWCPTKFQFANPCWRCASLWWTSSPERRKRLTKCKFTSGIRRLNAFSRQVILRV